MERIFITLIIASLGGLVGVKLKIPAGAMIGAMIFVAVYNIWSSKGFIPENFKIAAQVLVGGMLGLNFTMDTLYGLKQMLIPALVMILGLIVLSILLGFVISKTTGMDLLTSLFSSAPGGLTEMILTSEAYGADTSKVAVLHLIRLISVITVLPLVIKGFIRYIHG
ncbi:AbrB family transcriptional regulator [Geosporobacter ferrireducens]|uniref:AbrB family transcriptional regulator n=1 Tax=Geosporobacter ferrireducens TaxID=1424294 RepID=A0A1D8GMW8_9FIRM|nr:AbrB family transcriptional regulator [Geosporobacter ferrireducens]AOT72192.1 AbrB family transcriptional regulator [Geosporobacter ferrireducens]MTI56082.1 AbrB family transcriptional regulator [Geosporobacter ferrireducens]